MVEKRLSLPLPWTEVWARLKQALSDSGAEMVQSFDLQSARAALAEPDLCPCPYHGTTDCSCQYIVWMVRRKCGPPLSLVVHGHDDCTYISISHQSGDRIEEEIERLVTGVLNRLAPFIDQPSA